MFKCLSSKRNKKGTTCRWSAGRVKWKQNFDENEEATNEID
ncbi:MAG: hypothetical protein SOX84_07795 [Prevotella sp.]|nr:hypothetical protein [Prevotella sp.]